MKTLPDFFSSILTHLPQPPNWLIDEGHNRVVLLLNHILQQEPEAMRRLSRYHGKRLKFICQPFTLALTPTPVGLLTVVKASNSSAENDLVDLVIEVIESNWVGASQKMLQGHKPKVRIEGDVQFAAEVQWLVQNVQWDLEDDLARWMGDVPAHYIAKAVKHGKRKLQEWLSLRQPVPV